MTIASIFCSAENMNTFLTYLSWVEIFVFSFLISLGFNDQKMIIRILVFFASIILLGGGYFILGRLSNLNMLYVNSIIVLLFLLFVFVIIASPKLNNDPIIPKNPNPYIINGRITTKNQLRLFYEEQTAGNYDFETFVKSALSVARDTLNDDQWQLVKSLLEPIVLEFEEHQPFSKIEGQEKETLQDIYRLTSDYEKIKEPIFVQLKSLVDTIYKKDQKLYAEEKRNSQALTLSIVGLILTIILSSISICISLFGWKI